MAGEANASLVIVSRSGDLYVLSKGNGPRDPARTVAGETGEVGRVVPLGSLLAHLPISEPWVDVPEPEWPETVRAVAVAVAEWPAMIEP